MAETVTDVIVARQRQPERFSPMVLASIVTHSAVVGVILFAPADWRLSGDEPPRVVMTVSLSGAPGPRAGGLTPTGGLAVPDPPPEPTPPPRAVTPPPKPPEVTVPTKPRPRRRPQPPPKEKPRPGVTRTDTGTRGQGFGLSTGGAGGSGVQLDVADFCCPEYLSQMITLVQQNWQSRQGVVGSTLMKFTITRPGSIEGVLVERPSGFLALDLAAQQALLRTRLSELPPQFPNPTLTVHMRFEYQQ